MTPKNPSRRAAILGSLAVLPAAFIGRRLWLHFDLGTKLFNHVDTRNFSLPAVQGVTRADGSPMPGFGSAELKGQVSILHGFGAWCPDCHEEHPYFLSLVKEHNLQVYGLDFLDKDDRATAYLKENGNPFYALGADPSGNTTKAFGIRGVPSTLVLDKTGAVALTIHGPLNPERTATLLAKLKELG